jgi:hypothetical protein
LSLFPNRIERISEELTTRGDVQVPHGGEAEYVVDDRGRAWVRKSVITTGFQGLLGEAFGYLFSNALELNVPRAAVHRGEEWQAWLSELIWPVTHWDEGKIPFIENLDEIGRMLALDALLANQDRHRGNILLESACEEDDTLTVWPIDFGNALVGFPSDFLDMGTDVPDPGNLAPGLPVSRVESAAMETAHRAVALEDALIDEFCREACELVKEDTTEKYRDVLCRRCDDAPKIVSTYLATIENDR